MRVSDLAKELGKTNREVLDVLKRNDQDVQTYSASITDRQARMVKRAFGVAEGPKKKLAAVYRPQNSQQRPQRPQAAKSAGTAPAAPSAAPARPAAGASGAGSNAAVSPGAESARAAAPQSGNAAAKTTGELTGRVAQPQEGAKQNGSTQPQAASAPSQEAKASGKQTENVRAAGGRDGGSSRENREGARRDGGQGGRDGNRENRRDGASGARENRDADRRDSRRDGDQGTRENRDGSRRDGQGYQGSRDGNRRDGGRDGNRENRRDGQGYQGSRDGNRRDGQGYQGSRDGNRRDGQGYQGSRDGNRRDGQGYQGSRDGNRRDGQGYQGSRDGNRRDGQGYQGSRDGSRRDGQGYQGSRDGSRRDGQGYQGSRDGNRRDGQGYQGSRDGNRRDGQGYQGSRDGNRQGGYQGSRDANRSGQGRPGARPGQRSASSGSGLDTLQTKPGSNRQNKNAHKNDRYDKTRMVEDGPRAKGGKVSKHPFIMPQKTVSEKTEETVKVITLPDVLTIKELADKMKMQAAAIIKKLFLKGQMVTINSEIDFEKAEEIAMEYEILCEKEEKVDVIAELLKEDEENEEDMVARPPVVCVMGHVDHGKTSLLDAIRKTNVTAREAGGITQHIGAYTVEINGQSITFLDTPGHEAFTAMRMRGAQSTDIAILVVAADDGVMPQTIEAINHAKAAEVEIIVAINKIDKPSANVDRVKQELSEYGLIAEDWGGSTICVPVSAHTKEGIPELLEMILLTAEVKELRANPNRRARGLVIEAELDKGKGPVATILVQKGTLHVGDNVTAGSCYGKVRAMMDDKGRRVKEAGPSTPVEILGLNDVPGAGDVLMAMENEKEARSYAETFIAEGKNKLLEETKSKLSLDDLFSQIQAGNVKELPIIVKADVQGSVEAVKTSLLKLSNEEVVVKVIHGGVGAINESDVSLASASNAIIIGFNVRPDATAKSVAESEKVDMRLYNVIYQAIEDVESAMKGMLEPIYEEKVIGHAIVRQTFKASGVGTIAGSYVTDGKIQRNCKCRISRAGEQLFEGDLVSLKRFKDDVKEVATGYECGLVFDKFNDLQEDDMIEAYIMAEVPR